MTPEEPEALVLCWQIAALVAEVQEVRVDCVTAYHHTVMKHHPGSHQEESSGSGL